MNPVQRGLKTFEDQHGRFPPTHPGEVLREEFLKPLKMSQYALAKALAIPQMRVSEIVNGKRAITPDTALRLARYFGTSAEFWLGMQATFDLEQARDADGARISAEVSPARRESAQAPHRPSFTRTAASMVSTAARAAASLSASRARTTRLVLGRPISSRNG